MSNKIYERATIQFESIESRKTGKDLIEQIKRELKEIYHVLRLNGVYRTGHPFVYQVEFNGCKRNLLDEINGDDQ